MFDKKTLYNTPFRAALSAEKSGQNVITVKKSDQAMFGGRARHCH
jgi:hypothetical protein